MNVHDQIHEVNQRDRKFRRSIKLQATKHGGAGDVTSAPTSAVIRAVMDRFSWTSSSNLCVLPGESGIHQQSGVRIYDGDKKVRASLVVVVKRK